jgi:hypothetical protein
VSPPGQSGSSLKSGLGLVPWALVLLVACAGLYDASAGASLVLVQGLGVGILLTLGVPLVIGVVRQPIAIARPIYAFFLGCIYFFVLDMAILREVEEFHPETILVAETIIAIFLIVTVATWHMVSFRRTPLAAVLRRVDGNMSGNVYFWAAVLAFSLEFMRRLYFVGWSLPQLVHDLLLPRGQGAFRRGGAGGDWRIFLQPIEVLFWSVAFFADRAWKRGVSGARKCVLLVIVALQLGTLVLDGVRALLLLAILLPFFVRAVQRDPLVTRWFRGLALASFLLAPLMDTMVKVRGYGWSEISRVEQVHWNMVEAHRDDNFFWVVNLVEILRRDGGILAYKGPFGFIEGVSELGWSWLITPIPRAFWPDKPLATEMGDDTKAWNTTNSITGSLLRSGGVSFVVLGGVLFGIWLSLLDPLYPVPKGDGAAIAYSFLLVITIAGTRSISAWTIEMLLVIFLLVAAGWGGVRALRQLSVRLAYRT